MLNRGGGQIFFARLGFAVPRTDRPLLLYDGVCNLCHGAVRWILKRDRKQRFVFAALQSKAGQAALAEAGFAGETPDSVVVIDGDHVYLESGAALKAARVVGGLWSLLAVFWIVPAPIRNAVYRWVARNRYRWFGQKQACPMPDPQHFHRFLDLDE